MIDIYAKSQVSVVHLVLSLKASVRQLPTAYSISLNPPAVIVPIDRCYAGRRAQSSNDIVQMVCVVDLDVDRHVKEIFGSTGDLEIVDVCMVLADDGCERAQRAFYLQPRF